ncbi:unnamed protein product [Schistosoma margrebowiei]|uniref:Cathepsin B-like cysteine proteinase n=1 Tax=Schistosoma margrebowiei TaxID=48269 RepID=A0AA84ZCY0_9TREM|nr:unnamed protein product [Schistosoma margrebowiei]
MLTSVLCIASLVTLLDAHISIKKERFEPLSDDIISYINQHAFGAVEAMSDRTCIQSRGRQSVELSAVDLMSCCSDCGFGCEGGFPGRAWDYWVEEGIVTGSSKENHTGCQPYPFPKCEHHAKGKYPACGEKMYKAPRCKQTCQKSYKIPYAQDKHRGKLSYNVADDVLSIQKEIMKYGPVEAAFNVYEDFLNYKSGIYKHLTGEPVGGHAIRIIGWGVEKKTPYWLVANSWNEDWGENGYFKILRGHNECEIESYVIAGRAN